MYHRVGEPHDDPDLDPALLSASPSEFDEQIGFVARTREIVALPELLEARHGKRTIRPGTVMVTFDDAYRDFGDRAWPILRSHGVPATLFVPTAYPARADRRFWWDALYSALSRTSRPQVDGPEGPLPLTTDAGRRHAMAVLRAEVTSLPQAAAVARLRDLTTRLGAGRQVGPPAVLEWSDLRRLAREGVALAPHTRTHPRLDRMPLAEARDEIVGAAADLEREVGSSPPALAYPGGGLSPQLVEVVRECGFDVAFSTERGVNPTADTDWLRLRRINVGSGTSVNLLRAQLLPATWRLVERAA